LTVVYPHIGWFTTVHVMHAIFWARLSHTLDSYYLSNSITTFGARYRIRGIPLSHTEGFKVMTVMQLQLRQYSQSRGSYSSSGSSVAVTSSVIIRPNCTRLRPVQWDHKKLSERIGTRLYAAR
jgi:hypothetical protein